MKRLELSAKVLHKDHEDDILIRSAQPLLPAFITQVEYSKLPDSEESKLVFHKYYQLISNTFFLKGIPYKIDAKSYECGTYSDFYTELDGEYLLTSRYLPATTLRLLDLCEKPLNEYFFDKEDCFTLQHWLALHPGNMFAPVFSYIAKIDTENYFFYRKPHEHVPGLMLIEMARQSMYHYCYSCIGYDRGDVSISMNNLGLSCEQYVISSYELELLVTQRENQYRNKPKSIDKIARFYQRGQFVGSLTLAGSVIKTKLFKRLRKMSFPPTHWFKMLNENGTHVVVTDLTGHCTSVSLQSLSTEGVRIYGSPFEHYSHINFLSSNESNLTLPLKEHVKLLPEDVTELNFAELTHSQRNVLSELIKCKTIIHDYELPTDVQKGESQLSNQLGR
ncbi:AfsA-related hotdog domain-containing protein [Vibrio tasmaniensis]|uniref:AfsA-related hotdog domain-containing protein n=1 Tax=Vibrio tasmaniensis TaxID=212663 RepID=UPI001436717E|nr:AfsA-related hotdog domain-containing protein [Vibrio tasmaniensis]